MDKAEIAENLVKKMLGFLDAEAEISVQTIGERLRVNASVKEAGFLIGKEGENLKAIQHLLSLMFFKKNNESTSRLGFVFDINDYFKEKEDYLTALAKNAAQRALETKRSVELEPMTSFERRIIHLAAEGIEGISTESLGEGENRRVVVKPKE